MAQISRVSVLVHESEKILFVQLDGFLLSFYINLEVGWKVLILCGWISGDVPFQTVSHMSPPPPRLPGPFLQVCFRRGSSGGYRSRSRCGVISFLLCGDVFGERYTVTTRVGALLPVPAELWLFFYL